MSTPDDRDGVGFDLEVEECSHPACDRKSLRQSTHCIWHKEDDTKSIKGTETEHISVNNPYLSNLYLREIDFSKSSMPQSEFTHTHIDECDLRGASLRKSNMTDIGISDSNFTETILSRVDISNATINSTNMSSANLLKSDMSDATITSSEFVETYLFFIDLSNSNLEGVQLTNSDLTGADLTNASVTECDFSGATMCGADLLNCNIDYDILTTRQKIEARVPKEVLKKISIHQFDFQNEELPRAYLSDVDLSGKKLSKVNMSLANLSGADLSEVDLSGASLFGADLSSADLRLSDLSNVKFHQADLSGADLRGADLTGAEFDGATLTNTTLYQESIDTASGIETEGAHIYSSTLTKATLPCDERGTDISNIDCLEVLEAGLKSSENLMLATAVDVIGEIAEEYPSNLTQIIDPLLIALEESQQRFIKITAIRALVSILDESDDKSTQADKTFANLLGNSNKVDKEYVIPMSFILLRYPWKFPRTINSFRNLLSHSNPEINAIAAKTLSLIVSKHPNSIDNPEEVTSQIRTLRDLHTNNDVFNDAVQIAENGMSQV